jgi:FlaA1/EpsC-like NDP-sugar epimerase
MTASLQWFLIYIACVYLTVDYLYSIEIPRLILFFTLGIILILVSFERLIISLLYSSLLSHDKLGKRKLLLLMSEPESALLESLDTIHMYDIIGYANNARIATLDETIPYK